MKTKSILVGICILSLVVFGAALFFNQGKLTDESSRIDQDNAKIIAVTQIASHPALDEVREAIFKRLEEVGYSSKNGTKLVFKNANGDGSLTVSIAQEFARLNPDVIIPISTPSALAVANHAKRSPIVFSGVSEPVAVGLILDVEKPGGNITGVSDQWPYEDQISTYLKIFPDTAKIGMIYTSGDDVSKIGVDAVAELQSKLNFELVTAPLSQAQDVSATATKLFQEVDVIYVGIDHLLLENISSLIKISKEANKPLLGGESGSVEKGALMANSINMTKFGILTADRAIEVLQGANPGDLPVIFVSDGDQLMVNKTAARNLEIPLEAFSGYSPKFVE